MALFEGLSFDSAQCPGGNPLMQVLKMAKMARTVPKCETEKEIHSSRALDSVAEEHEVDDVTIMETKEGFHDVAVGEISNLGCERAVQGPVAAQCDVSASNNQSYAFLGLAQRLAASVWGSEQVRQKEQLDWKDLFKKAALANKSEPMMAEGVLSENETDIDALEQELDGYTTRFGELLTKRLEGAEVVMEEIDRVATEIEDELNAQMASRDVQVRNKYNQAVNGLTEEIDERKSSDRDEVEPADCERYNFYPNNPYLGKDVSFLTAPSQHKNIIESILCIEAALQDYPTRGDLWYQLGCLHQINESDRLAIAALENATKYISDTSDALCRLAISYANELNYVKAVNAIKSWVRCSCSFAKLPHHPEIADVESTLIAEIKSVTLSNENNQHLSKLHDVLGILMMVLGNYPSAASHFLSSLTLAGRALSHELLNRLGAAFISSREYAKAIDVYSRLLSNFPNYPRAVYNLGTAVYYHTNTSRNVIPYLMRALEIQNNSVSSLGLSDYFSDVESNFSREEDRCRFRSFHYNSIWSIADKFIHASIPTDPDIEHALGSRDFNSLTNCLAKHFAP